MARPRILSTLALVLLAATACGNVSDKGGGSSSGETPPGVTDNNILIGATLPLTGTASPSTPSEAYTMNQARMPGGAASSSL